MLPKEKGEGLTTQLIVESQKITQMSPPEKKLWGREGQPCFELSVESRKLSVLTAAPLSPCRQL